MTGAGDLYARCTRCANRCRIRLTIGDEGAITKARKQVLGRQTTYQECPNLERDVGIVIADLEAKQLVTR